MSKEEGKEERKAEFPSAGPYCLLTYSLTHVLTYSRTLTLNSERWITSGAI